MEVVEEFESLWQSNNGAPDVFVFLETHPDLPFAQRLTVLLLDQRLRWRTENPLAYRESAGVPRIR